MENQWQTGLQISQKAPKATEYRVTYNPYANQIGGIGYMHAATFTKRKQAMEFIRSTMVYRHGKTCIYAINGRRVSLNQR